MFNLLVFFKVVIECNDFVIIFFYVYLKKWGVRFNVVVNVFVMFI